MISLMNRFKVLSQEGPLDFPFNSRDNSFSFCMTKTTKSNYLNSDIKKVNEEDLKKALQKVRDRNKEIRESYRTDKDTMAFKVGR